MLILALETSGEVCSLALCDEEGLAEERLFRHRMRLSERLMGEARSLLNSAGASLRSVDLFAAGIGPGSFTGLRVGVTTVKTWADTLGRPAAGVSVLDAVAWERRITSGATVVPIVRARPDTVYAAIYPPDLLTEWTQPGPDPQLLTLTELADRVRDSAPASVVLCGEGMRRHGGALAERLLESGICVEYGGMDAPRASSIASIARLRFAAGGACDPLLLAPHYVSPPPIDPRVEERIRLGAPHTKAPGID